MRLLGQVELFIIVRSSEQQMIFIQSVKRVGVCVCVFYYCDTFCNSKEKV